METAAYVKRRTGTRSRARILSAMEEHETNTGWWTEKPDRQDRPSSYAALSGARGQVGRAERVWLRAIVVIALMVTFGWTILQLLAVG